MVAPITIGKYFLSCDWGTTSFRLSYMDAYSGMITIGISVSEGLNTLHGNWNQYIGFLNSIDFYLYFLEKHKETLETKLNQDLNGYPVMTSGMASSSIGIHELTYNRLPISLKNPHLHVEKHTKNQRLPNKIYLVSGLQIACDVMRGEETQLLGLNYKYGLDNGIFLLAGTHTKHMYIENWSITDFNTFITDELFELNSTQSILSQSISIHENTSFSKDFERGGQQNVDGNLLLSLFEKRIRYLIQNMSHSVNADYLSGLLIGTELAGLVSRAPKKNLIFGSSVLQKRYSPACNKLKINATTASTESSEDVMALGQRIILQQNIH